MTYAQLPQGWIPVSGQVAAALEAELKRELHRSHRLFGLSLNAIARREDRDDVLFRASTGAGRYSGFT